MKSWKTTVGGILAAVAVGLRKAPQTAPYADFVEMVGLALLGLSARDNNVTSEQAGAAPAAGAPLGKTLGTLFLVLGAAWLLFGCVNKAVVTTDAQGNSVTNFVKTVDVERVARLAGNAAQLGTAWAVAAHPETRVDIETAVAGLQVLEDGKDYDPAAFTAVMEKLPFITMNGQEGAIYISGAVMVWDEAVQEAEPLLKKELVAKVLPRVLAGMRKGLGGKVGKWESEKVSGGDGRRFLTVQEERELGMLPEVVMPRGRYEDETGVIPWVLLFRAAGGPVCGD